MQFWLEPPPRFGCLAIHLNRRRHRCTRVMACVVCWVCASASFCACHRVVVNCARVRPPRGRSVSSMRPQFTSVRGATPSGFNFVYFPVCQMGLYFTYFHPLPHGPAHEDTEHELTRQHVDWLTGQLNNIQSYTLTQ